MNTQSVIPPETSLEPLEESRRRQLIEVTIDSLAELGFVGTTLAQIAGRAGVSPGLVAHYFGDKDGLLDAAFRSLARRVGDHVRARLRQISTPRARIQAVIDANLSLEEFAQRTGTAWLAFWGQVLQVPSLKRVQSVYQRRTLTNLRSSLKKLVPPDEAQSLAAMIAAMIDGVWLRAALSGWREADSESARALLTEFVDGRLKSSTSGSSVAEGDAAAGHGAVTQAAAEAGRRAASPGPGERFASFNPATGEVLGYVTVAGATQVNAAVRAAQRGQAIWAAMTGAERARILRRAAEILRSRNRELAELETRDTGKPIQETLVVDVISGADCLEYFAALAQSLSGEHIDLGSQAFGYTRREPLGVVAGIGAWNYPLQIACWKAAPALACGNAMIFKPAELTPFTAVKLEEIFLEAGLPPGVFQVVQGFAATGRLLTRHPDIRKVSLTGEVGTGKAVMADAAQTLKNVTLELGGKSPLIVFDDAKLDNAVSGALLANFYSSGQVCSNATRVFVHSSIKAAFLEKLVKRVSAMRVGDPMDPATQVGALVSEQHMQKVLSYIDRGRAEGARLLIGGNRVTAGGLGKGNFVAPAVFDNCRDDMGIVREEIFGPVMSVMEFDDEREVIQRANATEFGLAAGVFTNDLTRGHRVIAQLQAGTCWINHYNVTPIELPFGGVKMSGLGRENGRAAIEHYTQLKSVYVAMGDVDAPY
ncbi:MAG TPA: betaine-aldehyde dehydrogenase [Steroidobacteraceae bacterium]|nr:betaine-aldehyde dehydrogenase [Steroidobacteraceae bacterium]